jgi:hypothetical protein
LGAPPAYRIQGLRQEILAMIRTHLVYNDVIEHAGRLGTGPTLLGVILIGIALFVLAGIFIFIAF